VFSVRSIVVAAAFAVCVAATQILPVAAVQTQTAAVESFAQRQLHKPYRLGGTGLRRYDCSGLVYRTYFETGLLKKISGRHRRARGYYNWFRDHNLITKSPRPGDLVVWAHKHRAVSHIGIFIGWNQKGRPMAISALTTGVARHRVNTINIPFKAYLRVNLDR
jgi:cell wall-associated NlpC family hydrolase